MPSAEEEVHEVDLVVEGGEVKAASLPRLIERLTAARGKAIGTIVTVRCCLSVTAFTRHL